MAKAERDIYAQARCYVRQIELLEKEVAKQKKLIEHLQATIEASKAPVKKQVLKAIDEGCRTTTGLQKKLGIKIDSIRSCVYRLYDLGVLRRRGPYPVKPTGGTEYYYGRALNLRRPR